jgi:hypothetical protein
LARKLQSQARGCGWADRVARRPRGRLACCASLSQGSEAADSPVRWAGPARTRPAGQKCRSSMAPRLRPPYLRNLDAETGRWHRRTADGMGCPRSAPSRASILGRPSLMSAPPRRWSKRVLRPGFRGRSRARAITSSRRIPGVRPAFRLGSSQQMQNISTVPIASPAFNHTCHSHMDTVRGRVQTEPVYVDGSSTDALK